MSEWMESVKRWNVGLRILFPNLAIRGPTERTLRFWDSLRDSGKVVAIGGVDVHAMKKRFGPFNKVVFPYPRIFRTIRTHILSSSPLTGQLGKDKEAVYGALRRGNSFVSNRLLGDGRGFRFFAEAGNAVYAMGESLHLSRPTRAVAISPGKGLMSLIRNGEPILRRKANSLEYDLAEPGSYRIEVRRGRAFWILSNPIHVT